MAIASLAAACVAEGDYFYEDGESIDETVGTDQLESTVSVDTYYYWNANVHGYMPTSASRGYRLKGYHGGTITLNQGTEAVYMLGNNGNNQSNLAVIEIGGDNDASDSGDRVMFRNATREGFLCAAGDAARYSTLPLYNCIWTQTITSTGKYAFQSYAGKWLSAQPNATLEANRTALGPWEQFTPF